MKDDGSIKAHLHYSPSSPPVSILSFRTKLFFVALSLAVKSSSQLEVRLDIKSILTGTTEFRTSTALTQQRLGELSLLLLIISIKALGTKIKVCHCTRGESFTYNGTFVAAVAGMFRVHDEFGDTFSCG
jgi:hypothetical protein